MRDLIWTIILIWLVWKVYEMFKRVPQKSKVSNPNTNNSNQRKEGEVKIETTIQQKTYFGKNDGEYVDYEEVK